MFRNRLGYYFKEIKYKKAALLNLLIFLVWVNIIQEIFNTLLKQCKKKKKEAKKFVNVVKHSADKDKAILVNSISLYLFLVSCTMDINFC